MSAPESSLPTCPPPDPNTRAPRFPPPANACDCHAHVIGPARLHPFVPDRSYTPPDALLPDYLKVLRTLGITRAVLVQPSMHGSDNSVMMNAIAESRDVEMRAVVVVPAEVSDEDLERLHAGGARGVRLNVVYRGGGMGLDAAVQLARRIRPLGWHLELLVDVSAVPQFLRQISKLDVPLVFAHLGHMPAGRGTRDKGFIALLELLRRGNTWVKLSGAYRVTADEYPYEDVRPLAEALIEAAPGRLLWGTDWPHTICRVRMPNDGELLDLLYDWVRDAALLKAILVDAPAALYGFKETT